MDFKINFDDLPFSVDFNHIVYGKYAKLQTIIYYLTIPQGSDILHPDLGIVSGLYSRDKTIIIIELENLFFRIKEKFGINVILENVSVNSAENKIEITIQIEEEKYNIGIEKERVIKFI